jgi:hypothetical protein
MKRSIFVLLFAFTALFFTACSSGGDDDGGGGGGPTPLQITVQPQDLAFAKDSTITNDDITPFSFTTTGGSGTITYQWYSNTIDSTSGGNIISGATEKTYAPDESEIITSSYGSYYYYVEVTAGSETVTSRVAAIDIAVLISTAGDLAVIDPYYSSGVLYKLTKDIDLSVGYSTGWTPIGTSSSNYSFRGTFKGGNKKISGLYINTTSNAAVGLFGYLGAGAKVSDVTVKIDDRGITGYTNVGGIAGYADGSSSAIEIKNVHVEGSVNGIKSNATGDTYIGGIVGQITGTVSIRDSSNSAKVTSSSVYTANCGGIAGKTGAATTIYNSFNSGLVTVNSSSTNNTYRIFAGGIAGDSAGTIGRSYNEGAVQISSYQPSFAGGIAGRVTGTGIIFDSYNKPSVYVSTGNTPYAGGIAGMQDGSASIAKSYNTGDVTAQTTSTSNIIASAGGITGIFDSSGQTLENNVAANSSLTASPSGSGTTEVNRILGNPSNRTYGGNLSNNIALSTMTATVSGSDYSFVETNPVNYGIGKTAAELKQKATYTGLGWKFGEDNDNVWDDSNPWKATANGYPVLYWQK